MFQSPKFLLIVRDCEICKWLWVCGCVQDPALSFDVQQLADSMSSITFDQTTLNSGDCITTANSQRPPALSVFDPAANPGQHNLGGPDDTGQTIFGEDAALSQTPMTLASPLGVNFSLSVTFQPSPASSSYVETTAELAPSGDDMVDRFGVVDLQDMIISDDF